MPTLLDKVNNAITALKNGDCIIVTDDSNRENEADLIIAAEHITAEKIAFFLQHTSGIICLALDASKINQLQLAPMVQNNKSCYQTPFTVSIEAKEGITTGVSASDRAKTILTAISLTAKPEDLVQPGHIFPLHAQPNGVLQRAGHTEASVDLVKLANLQPGAVLCELMHANGEMMRDEALNQFAMQHHFQKISIQDIINYRLLTENNIIPGCVAALPSKYSADFKCLAINEIHTNRQHLVVYHNVKNDCLVRIHSACLTGDAFHSLRCDCQAQLDYSLTQIADQGGMVIYLDQEGRGIGLSNKINAYALQDKGHDTYSANVALGLPVDARDYAIAAQIIKHFALKSIKLLSDNPHKISTLKSHGIDVEQVILPQFVNEHNQSYIHCKTHFHAEVLRTYDV